jgi:hypothetical protein
MGQGEAADKEERMPVLERKIAGAFIATFLFAAASPAVHADNTMVMAMAGKMREQGMTSWRNGDFLSAYGNCFGARQMLLRLKGAPEESVARGAGYAELCMSLALYQMNIRSKNHSPCKLLVEAQKKFRLADEVRKAKGMTADDGGYIAELIKDRGCRAQAKSP